MAAHGAGQLVVQADNVVSFEVTQPVVCVRPQRYAAAMPAARLMAEQRRDDGGCKRATRSAHPHDDDLRVVTFACHRRNRGRATSDTVESIQFS